MLTSFIVAASQLNVRELTLDGILAAYRNLSSAEIRATVRAQVDEGPSNITYFLAFDRPGKMRLTLDYGQGPRTVFVDGRNLSLMDNRSMQVASVAVTNEQPLATAIQAQDPAIDPLLIHMANGGSMNEWLEPIRALKPWKVTWNGNAGRMTFNGKDGKLELRFDQRLLLTGFEFNNQQKKTTWTIRTSGLNRSNLEIPGAAARVKQIDQRYVPPTFADAQARALTDRVMRAYDRMRTVNVVIEENGQPVEIAFGDGKAWQKDAKAEWSFGRGVGRLNVPGRRVSYAGNLDWSQMIDAVAQVGSRVDPFLRQLVRGQNPIREIMGRGVRVSVMGKAQVAGQEVTILKAKSSGAIVDLYVRERDGLVLSIGTLLEENGVQRQISQRNFTYKSGAARALAAPSGFTSQDIKAILSPEVASTTAP